MQRTRADTSAGYRAEPTPLVAEVHKRMSLIIDPVDWEQYLQGSADEARMLVKPNPMHDFERVLLSNKVNSVKNDGPQVLEPGDPNDLIIQPDLFS